MSDHSCPFADHFERCPNFAKTCDAINCWSKVTWEEERAIRQARGEKLPPLSLLKPRRAR